MEQDKQIKKFRVYNMVMGLLHLVQAIIILILSNNFKLPVNTNFLQFNEATRTLDTTSSHLFDIRFGYGVALFFLLSAIFHLCVATFYNKTYSENLVNGINKARWYEYSLSSSVMIVLIAMLSGIYDLSTLVMMFGLTAIMNLCGLAMEQYNLGKKEPNWLVYWLGCLAGALPWVVIIIYFLGAASVTNNAIPTFVYWIYVSIFIFFNCFAINMYLQYKKVGSWKSYLYGEGVYILLSLVAKSLLAWQIFAGTLRPM